MNFRAVFAALGLSLVLSLQAPAQNLPADHATTELVKKYLEAVVKQDWKTAADMLLPASLERRRVQMIAAVQNSPTMTDEAQKLAMLGLRDIKELEKLTPQQAYVADREAVHRRMRVPTDVIKKKQETLKINILGLVPEDSGKIVHALVRTTQDTNEVNIEELLLISLIQDKDDAKKWHIVPDMQQPITTPLSKTGTGTQAAP